MNNSVTTAKLWRLSALLLVLDIVLVYSYIWQPVGLPSGPSTWDFRIAALRDFEDQKPVIAPKTSINTLLDQYFATNEAATTIQPFWQSLPISAVKTNQQLATKGQVL